MQRADIVHSTSTSTTRPMTPDEKSLAACDVPTLLDEEVVKECPPRLGRCRFDKLTWMIGKITELSEELHELQLQLILLAGDVETNPGPPRGKKKPKAMIVPAGKKGSYMIVPGVEPGKGGRGGFFDFIKYIPRGLGAAAGLLKGGLGGVKSGWETGGDISKAIGLGKYGKLMKRKGGYEAAGGELTSGLVRAAAPVPFMHSDTDSVRLCRREYIGDVIASATPGAFKINSLEINPGLDSFLVWGAAIFGNFQEYSIEGMMVTFKSSCSSYASAGAIGTVAIGCDYNAANAESKNQTELEYLSGTRVSRASDDLEFYIECDPRQNTSRQKYIRVGDVPSGMDKRLYDWGLLQIASNGVPTASLNLGKLYLSYDIKAYKPKVGRAAALNSMHYQSSDCKDATPLGTMVKKFDNLASTVTATTITFPRGTYGKFYGTMHWAGGSSVTIVHPAITYTNATAKAYFNPITSAGYEAPASATASIFQGELGFAFEINDPATATVITFGTAGTLPTSNCAGDLKIVEISPDFA